MTLPNLITIARLLSVPAIIGFLILDQYTPAFVVFLLAGMSDGVDGFLAKRFKMTSELGAYLDPIADKALLTSIYVTLSIKGLLPVLLTVLVVSRDFLIVGAVLLSWMMRRPVVMAPLPVSKVNTAAQIVLAGTALLAASFSLQAERVIMMLVWLVGILTVVSAIAYIAAWLRHMAPDGRETPLDDGTV